MTQEMQREIIRARERAEYAARVRSDTEFYELARKVISEANWFALSIRGGFQID